MIIEALLNSLKSLIFALFSWINLPGIGDDFDNALSFLDVVFTNAQTMVNLFFPWDLVRFGIPIIIIVENFEEVYNFIMWIVEKIPFIDMDR